MATWLHNIQEKMLVTKSTSKNTCCTCLKEEVTFRNIIINTCHTVKITTMSFNIFCNIFCN